MPGQNGLPPQANNLDNDELAIHYPTIINLTQRKNLTVLSSTYNNEPGKMNINGNTSDHMSFRSKKIAKNTRKSPIFFHWDIQSEHTCNDSQKSLSFIASDW